MCVCPKTFASYSKFNLPFCDINAVFFALTIKLNKHLMDEKKNNGKDNKKFEKIKVLDNKL